MAGKEHVSILVTAQSGTGKSYLVTYLIQNMGQKYQIIADIEDEYVLPGFSVYRLTKKNYQSFLKDFKKILLEKEKLTIRFIDFENQEMAEILNYICNILFQLRNCLLVLDETHEIVPKYKCPIWIRKIATAGRKYGISSIFITQRPQFLVTSLRTQTNVKITGKLTDPNDTDAIKHSFRHHEKIPYLKPRNFIYSSKTGQEYLFSTESLQVRHDG